MCICVTCIVQDPPAHRETSMDRIERARRIRQPERLGGFKTYTVVDADHEGIVAKRLDDANHPTFPRYSQRRGRAEWFANDQQLTSFGAISCPDWPSWTKIAELRQAWAKTAVLTSVAYSGRTWQRRSR